MIQVDYMVIGIGLAGINFCEQLRANNKSFMVFDNASQQSSTVAAGLYNPVVLKRFTPIWKAEEHMNYSLNMYARLEKELKVKLDYKIPVYRKFATLEEQNDWFLASDKPILSKYLSDKIIKNENNAITAPFGFGKVNETGRIDVKTLIDAYKILLLRNKTFNEDTFNYEKVKIDKAFISYQNIKARKIVFAEGFGITHNPYFNNLPLVPTKGELITIHAPELKVNFVLKSGVFLIPLKQDLYLVGATYDWDDMTQTITRQAFLILTDKLKKTINCPFKVVNQVAGIRPTVKDRKPLVGQHPLHRNMFVLNGLGTRGVMIGPYVSEKLFNFIEKGIPLEVEIDISRFS